MQAIDSAGEGIQPAVDDSQDYHRAYRRTAQDFAHHQRKLLRQTSQLWKNMECEPRDCEVETALDRLLNDIVVPATEITVTTWIYFGKMSNKFKIEQTKTNSAQIVSQWEDVYTFIGLYDIL